MKRPRSIIIGLGSPIRTDDAVGLVVARLLHERIADPDFELREMAVGGIELVEALVGYERAVIVDAIQTDGGRIGDCSRFALENSDDKELPAFTHQVGLLEGLELGRRLGLDLPPRISVYVVEVADAYTISEEMTEAVKAAVPGAVDKILVEEDLLLH